MFVAGNLIQALATVMGLVLNLYMWIIIIRTLISWVNPDPYNPIVQFLYSITEPALRMVRQLLPIRGIGIDLAPLILILVIVFLKTFLVNTLFQLAHRMN